MKSNTEQLKIAAKYLGESCPKCCSMKNNCCCYFVSKIFKEAGNASLFYGGQVVTYCPNAIKWCKANLAQIPVYLAMPSDIIFFDWELNGVPNHIGFVDHRLSDTQIATLEGNTTASYVVARRTRDAKYVQGVFRPHFKADYKTGALEVDGQFGYNSIAMFQKVLGIKVDGVLGKDTVKALQRKAGTAQDGSWGVNTSKAVQKMIGVTVDGAFGEKSVKALQTWINKQMGNNTESTDKTASAKPQAATTPSDVLVVDGAFGKKSITKAQKYFGTTQDGVISGQLKSYQSKLSGIDASCITWGGKGSNLVRAMQKKFGLSQDGVLGTYTIKALQQFLAVTVDGSWGTKTSRAFQTFLNEPSTYKTGDVTIKEETKTSTTWQDKANAWAKSIAASGKYKYKNWSPSNANTHKCPICHPGTGNGWNCIGFAFACWRHGGGLKSNCSCSTISNGEWEKILAAKTQEAASKLATQKVGIPVTAIRNGGNTLPLSALKKGDIIAFFHGNEYYHTAYYMGDGKYADSTSGRTPNIKAGMTLSATAKANLKVAIRYTGK